MTDAEVYASSVMVGAVAGMRSLSAPALVSHIGSTGGLPAEHSAFSIFTLPAASTVVKILAVGELIVDKMPFAPKRTIPAAVVTRAIAGAVCGAAICSSKKRSVFWGAVFGAAAAIGTTYAAYELRKRIKNDLHIPDTFVALAEDALVSAAGAGLIRSLRA